MQALQCLPQCKHHFHRTSATAPADWLAALSQGKTVYCKMDLASRGSYKVASNHLVLCFKLRKGNPPHSRSKQGRWNCHVWTLCVRGYGTHGSGHRIYFNIFLINSRKPPTHPPPPTNVSETINHGRPFKCLYKGKRCFSFPNSPSTFSNFSYFNKKQLGGKA